MNDIVKDLQKIMPADRVLIDPGQLSAYECDALTVFRQRPLAVVLPETQEEVISIVRWCYRHQVPFVARGSGTSLSGGALPCQGGIVIAVNRLNRIVRYRPAQRTITVEPGVVNRHVSDRVAADGMHYAPDPSSGPVCTIGGNVAFNSGGAHCLKYGMTSNHVLGLRAVLPDGTVFCTGSDSLETVGADLTGMFVGCEGLFGIALEVTLRLLPIPERYHTVLAAYDSLAKAGDAVSQVVACGLLPGAMEIMDSLAIGAAEQAVGAGYPLDAAAILIVELEGTHEQVDADILRLEEVLGRSGASTMVAAANEQHRQTIWKGRKSAFSAVGRISPNYIVQDGVVPRAKLGSALEQIQEIGRSHGIRIANVFHAGDGNLHPLILFDGNQPGQAETAEKVAAAILEMCVRMGGSITGEHGVGVEKLAYLPHMFSPTDIEVSQRIRRQVDPLELANRGKMLPSAEAPVLSLYGPHPLERAGVISRE